MNHLLTLTITFLLIQSISAQTNKAKDEALIKAARKSSNEAFLNHDAEGIGKAMLDEFVGVWGNGGSTVGKDSVVARLKRSLDQMPGLTYVRTPNKITISDSDTLAFETGKWIGLKTKEKNPKWLSGNYSAMWWKRDGVWKIRSELFVTLKHY